tara:strand:- start:1559 stop:2278 length:720 start_codon:yes stop_codon:yes gene_type:complete
MSFGSLLLGLLISCNVRVTEDPFSLEVEAVPTCHKSTKGLRYANKSSVQISFMVGNAEVGKASGNYFKYRGNTFILTAAHVADASRDATLIVKERVGIDYSTVRVAYSSETNDLAILVLDKELETVDPIKWKRKDRWDVDVGDSLYYTGHPMDMDHLSFEGFVSRVYLDTIVMQGFAYMGSSGSAVFDGRGRVVGVISAIKFDVPGGAFPQLIPTMVLVGPISILHNGELHNLLEEAKK